jgi:hypothetical protein
VTRELARLDGRRYESLSLSEWLTFLFAREHGATAGWTRSRRRRHAAHWARLELHAFQVDYLIARRLSHRNRAAVMTAVRLRRERPRE